MAGESGGGGLAACLSLLARERGAFPVSAQFLLYPMLDDRAGTPAEPDPLPYTGEQVLRQPSLTFLWHFMTMAPKADVSVRAFGELTGALTRHFRASALAPRG